MSFFVVGGLLAAAGAVMVGFGILINEFSLGNTLIIAGAITFVGGLVLIALGDVVRQLRQVAESLMPRSSGRQARESFEPAMPGAVRPELGTANIPFPRKPMREAPGREPAPFEQRFGAAAALDRAEEGFQRTASFEPQIVPERDEAPLSPREPTHGRREPQFAYTEVERRALKMRLGGRAPEASPFAERKAEMPEAPRQNEAFESLWPAPRQAEPPAEQGRGVERAEQPAEAFQPPPEQAEPHAVSILKSGVVDGMAYTLYSDGSIEAEMPEGTVRFASITELRAYLEQSS